MALLAAFRCLARVVEWETARAVWTITDRLEDLTDGASSLVRRRVDRAHLAAFSPEIAL